MYLTTDAVSYMIYANYVGIVSVCLYLLIVPESPRWLMIQGREADAIKSLNYIAWFNGSQRRVPQDGKFDLLDQVLL